MGSLCREEKNGWKANKKHNIHSAVHWGHNLYSRSVQTNDWTNWAQPTAYSAQQLHIACVHSAYNSRNSMPGSNTKPYTKRKLVRVCECVWRCLFENWIQLKNDKLKNNIKLWICFNRITTPNFPHEHEFDWWKAYKWNLAGNRVQTSFFFNKNLRIIGKRVSLLTLEIIYNESKVIRVLSFWRLFFVELNLHVTW